MPSLSTWLQAARPKTLAASISPVLIGSTLALSTGSFDMLIFFFTLMTALGIQVGTNFANDYYDFMKGADTHLRKGPIRVTQAGLVSAPTMQRITFALFAVTITFALPLIARGGWVIALLLALSIALGLLYTAGPYPLAYLGLGDFFVFVFFGPIATGITAYLQTGVLSWKAFLSGIASGALSTAILTVNNIRDIEEDRLSGKKTLSVRFGRRFAEIEYISMLLLAGCIPLLFWHEHPFGILASLILLPALFLIPQLKGPYYNSLLAKTGKLLLLYTLLFCIGWML